MLVAFRFCCGNGLKQMAFLLRSLFTAQGQETKMQAFQDVVVKKDGQQGGGLANALKHCSWSPIRWTSNVESCLAMVKMFLACVLCLVDESEDTNRKAEDRDKSSDILASCG